MFLHYLYCHSCFQENWSFDWFYEVSFSWDSSVSLKIYHTPCMKCCCHVRDCAPICYLELLDKLQKKICRTVGPSLAISLEPLPHCRNVASFSFFYRQYFGRYSFELAQLAPHPFFRGRSTRYSDRLHDFLSPFLDVTRMSMSTVSFLALLNSGIFCLQNAFF